MTADVGDLSTKSLILPEARQGDTWDFLRTSLYSLDGIVRGSPVRGGSYLVSCRKTEKIHRKNMSLRRWQNSCVSMNGTFELVLCRVQQFTAAHALNAKKRSGER